MRSCIDRNVAGKYIHLSCPPRPSSSPFTQPCIPVFTSLHTLDGYREICSELALLLCCCGLGWMTAKASRPAFRDKSKMLFCEGVQINRIASATRSALEFFFAFAWV